MACWEEITGLTPAEVLAHGDDPLDSLLDSLMSVEFAAVVGGNARPPASPGNPSAAGRCAVSWTDLEPLFAAAGKEAVFP